MGRQRKEIRDDFSKYQSLCYEKKLISRHPVTFSNDKPSRPDWLYNETVLKHSYRLDGINLISQQKKVNNCSYKFQIRCADFCVEPLFRFDSDGSAHQNKHLPLGQQQVLTPHFNCFNGDGIPIAYQTDEIKIEDYSELKDIAKYFGIFCKETYIVVDGETVPGIEGGDMRILDLDLHNEDLLSDINFEL